MNKIPHKTRPNAIQIGSIQTVKVPSSCRHDNASAELAAYVKPRTPYANVVKILKMKKILAHVGFHLVMLAPWWKIGVDFGKDVSRVFQK